MKQHKKAEAEHIHLKREPGEIHTHPGLELGGSHIRPVQPEPHMREQELGLELEHKKGLEQGLGQVQSKMGQQEQRWQGQELRKRVTGWTRESRRRQADCCIQTPLSAGKMPAGSQG